MTDTKKTDSQFMYKIRSIVGDDNYDINDTLLAFSGSSSMDSLNFIVLGAQAFFVVLIALISVMLIYNIFALSYDERAKYLGMLSSVGATGKQKRSSVYFEAFTLLLPALPIGFALGLGTVKIAANYAGPMAEKLFSFDGTGLSFTFPNAAGNNMTAEFRSGEMELPTCLNIGASYDFLIEALSQRITIAGAFTSNAFLKDNFALGLEYSLLNIFSLRCGYVYQTDIFDKDLRTTANTGIHAGASVDVPLAKKGSDSKTALTVDYSYRTSANLRGTHAIGATFKF